MPVNTARRILRRLRDLCRLPRLRRVLLIADLEGITGVEAIEDLVSGAPGYRAAAQRMTAEVAFVAAQLVSRGVESICVSDAHHSGAPSNLDATRLPSCCEVRVEDDMYAGALLDGVEAVVCVGMHASGASAGFGAHTVSLNTAWTLGSLALTETHLVWLLAAERGVPVWCSAGDDVLEQQLAGVMPFVRTKRAVSRGEARSRPLPEVQGRFGDVLGGGVAALPVVPRAPLRLRFQRVFEADAAARAGGRRVSATELELEPAHTFQRQYEQALGLVASAEDALLSRIEGEPGTALFLTNAARLLLEPWEH